jgi:hypothetical protein
MKKFFLFVFASLLIAGAISQSSFAQVKVKFIANTSTISDTINTTSKLAVTGNKAAVSTWGDGIQMKNIGGDYWSVEISFAKGDTVFYKFRANGGWETNLSSALSSDNRTLVVGSSDTTLPVQFYNGTNSTKPQYFKPYAATPDSMFTVWIRVNMQAVMENQSFRWTPVDKDSVAAMGLSTNDKSVVYGPDLNWDKSFYLTQESNPYFFSGRARIRKSLVTEGMLLPYKFRLGYTWGRDELSGKNRFFPVPIGLKDTTLAYVYFNNDKPVVRVNKDTTVITFNVDLANAIDARGFQTGDTLVVQSGFFNTSLENGRQKKLNLVIGSKYRVTDTVVTSNGKLLDYQYYVIKNGIAIRENYFNFDYQGTASSERERRQITVSSKSFSFNDFATSPSDARRQPQFPSQSLLSKSVKVKWLVDLRPAYAKVRAGGTILDEQGDATVNSKDSIKIWGVGINGPATNLPDVNPVGDWATWNRDMVADTSKRKMYDDGTHGDKIAGDTIYTVELTYPSGTNAGRVYKFGIRGGDNEGGNGKAFGNNHVANISDVNTTYQIYTEWGSINPLYYSEWKYTGIDPTGVISDKNSLPVVFALDQNYPNPFNPSTSISFAIPIRSNVKLSVYNVIGQEVSTLVNENLDAGNHIAQFNASSLASGVYFYKLNAGNFTSIKKMMLLK